MSTAALILAAGEGTRMRSDLPKVAHAILGTPMIQLVVETARQAGCDPVVVVTGHRAEAVEALLPGEICVRQEQQLGTAHAVMSAADALAGVEGSLLVLSGDTPLMTPATLQELVDAREASGAAVALLTTRMPDPTGYGRILRDGVGEVDRIVEQKDCHPGQLEIDEVNTGTYCFDAQVLLDHLGRIGTDNAQGEFYLTDIVAILREEGLGVASVRAADHVETMGINTRVHLAEASRALQLRINTAHMLAGVTMTEPDLVWISPGVQLGRDVTIEPMTFLTGETVVMAGAVIGPSARIEDSFVGENARVDSSVLRSVRVGAGANVGPMGYLRPGTVLQANSKTGAFVEVKKSTIGEGSKVPHLSYIGDATIGRDVNVGAGSITCNYDGVAKHRTEIGDGAFIGSDTMLVAPVRVGAGATTGAGSAITKDVPDGALGIERTEQKTVDGWAERRRQAQDGPKTQGSGTTES